MSRLNVANFRHPDATADAITLTNGGDTQINRALGLGGATYGTSGQFLQSQGSGSAPQWATVTDTTGNDYSFASGSASGSSILITGIPSTAMQITVNLNGIGWSSAGSTVYARVGNSAGIRSTSGDYEWTGGFFGSGTATTYDFTGCRINYGFTAANDRLHGSIVLNKFSSNTWKVTYQSISSTYTNTTYVLAGAGSAYAGGTLDRLELSVSAGSFNTGSYNVNVLTE